jgi:hypothetical protein
LGCDSAEEEAYDKEHRELLGIPPGGCVKPREDYPTRAAGWLAAVRAQQAEWAAVVRGWGVDADETTDDSRTAWVMRGTVCAYPPYRDRNSCHGTQGIGEKDYASEAECKAAFPRVLKKKYPGYRVSEPYCELGEKQEWPVIDNPTSEPTFAARGCDPLLGPCKPPKKNTLHVVGNGFLNGENETFATRGRCEKEGTRLLYEGKIRAYACY